MKKKRKGLVPYLGTTALVAAAFYSITKLWHCRLSILQRVTRITEGSTEAGLRKRDDIVHGWQHANENLGPLNFKYRIAFSHNFTDVFNYLRKLENFSSFIPELITVEPINRSNSVYCVHIKILGISSKFYLFIVKEKPNSFFGWSSEINTLFYNTGKFELYSIDNSEGTTLDCAISITPPGGKIGFLLVKPFYPILYRRLGRCLMRMHMMITSAENKLVM